MKKILIVGGVAGGASTAARLRRNDETAQIIVFEKGSYVSYANCGLPYYLGDVIKDREQLFVQSKDEFSKVFNLDIRTCSMITSVNVKEKTVTVTDLCRESEYTESYDFLVLSPGAKPLKPPINNIDCRTVFTLRNVNDTDKIKKHLNRKNVSKAVIIGAGYIGLEMAENLSHLCPEVTLVEMADRILPFFDYEMSAIIEQHLKSNNVNVLVKERVISIDENSSEAASEVVLDSGKRLPADLVILATGVKPDTGFLAKSGIELISNGSIVADEYLRTNAEDVYALGDAIRCKHKILGLDMNVYLAGPASKQGRIVADNITYGNKRRYEGTIGTAIIKLFDIIAGYTGVSEEVLKRQKRPYFASHIHNYTHAGYYPDSQPISIKLIFSPESGIILGAQVIGFDGVDKRLDVLAALIQKEGTVFDLGEFDHAYAPPFSSARDPLTLAGFVAENIISGRMNIVQWYDINADLNNDVQLLDVRTDEEHQLGSIPHSKLIPHDELREKINEIPKGKKIIVYCRSGHRAYLACRILMQKGFNEVYNLSGGYKTYETAHHLNSVDNNQESSEEEAVTSNVKDADSSEIAAQVTLKIDACGLQCPGPIMKLKSGLDKLDEGEALEIRTTDPGFINDLQSWCRVTGNELVKLQKEKNANVAIVKKNKSTAKDENIKQDTINIENRTSADNKTLIVFSDDLDRALASFVIANGAAAMGKQVTMFFTFWGLNVIKKEHKIKTKKDFMGMMFGKMMPANSKGLNLSKMNMMGMGKTMMRSRMKSKQVDSLETMIQNALNSGVRLIACQMSMDVMGVAKEDLIEKVTIGGVATYLEEAEKANLNLFI